MPRTNAIAVQAILLDDYGVREDGSFASLDPFVDTANAITSRVATCAAIRNKTLSPAELELIERWLSAHFYVMSDQNYTSRSTGGASGSFQGQTQMHLEASKYGQVALDLDWSGCLTNISKRQFASADWLGKAPSEQTSYSQRD